MAARRVATALALMASTMALAAQAPSKSGIDRVQFDASVRAQDDFFRHVNGTWLKNTQIPEDRSSYGTFVLITDRTEANLRALVEGVAAQPTKPAGSVAQQVGDLYHAFMDEAAIDARGVKPIADQLAEVEAIATPKDLATVLGRQSMAGLPGPVGGYVEADVDNPTQYALYLSQSGTQLPDRDYYLVDNPKFVEVRAKYVAFLEKIFTLTGRTNAAADAKAVMDLETALARVQWTKVESRDAVKTHNVYPVSKLVQDAPGFDWVAWAAPQGIGKANNWVISEPSYFKAFAAMVPTVPLSTWKAWTAAQVITQHAPLLSKPVYDTYFAMFGTALTGQPMPRDRWKRGISLINEAVGEGLGRLYVERHFPPTAKARMQAMITNLIEAYRQSISTLDWMTPATRTAALAKLAKFSTKIGYPDRWRDYSALKIVPGDIVGNMDRARVFEAEYQIAKLGKTVDRRDWQMTPQTVNAYYNPPTNEIVFPAAILQPPFFDVTADDAVNYGAIGAFIGHEIGHGFDDQGREYDGDGRLRDWWTPADEAEFKKRADLLVKQFSSFSPLPGVNVNGELTLGENIGDLGGLSIAYKAWKLSLNGKTAPVIDGLTGDQRYFMGWAQAWRAKARDAYLQQQVLADPHAWAEFRVNGPVSNIDAFYGAFDLKPGDKLYREPDLRVKIW
ncbi:MAG: M13-type metalloendopeptidase [Acidobacteriota bacterium]